MNSIAINNLVSSENQRILIKEEAYEIFTIVLASLVKNLYYVRQLISEQLCTATEKVTFRFFPNFGGKKI